MRHNYCAFFVELLVALLHYLMLHLLMLRYLMLHYLLLHYLMLQYINGLLFDVAPFNVEFHPFMQLVSRYTRSSLQKGIWNPEISRSTNNMKLKLTQLVLLDKRCYFILLLYSRNHCACVPCVCVSERYFEVARGR